MCCVQIEPYVMVDGRGLVGAANASGTYRGGSAGALHFTGYIPDLLDQLMVETGLHYELHVVAEGSYGYRAIDGSWSGMIGEVLRGVSQASNTWFRMALAVY